MHICHAVRGEGSKLEILARTPRGHGIVCKSREGRRNRDAGKLSMNRGKSAVYIYTHILLTVLITDCAPLVLIRVII